MDKFRGKYRIASARLSDYDYGQAGTYFITICTHNRLHYFGEIKEDKMILNGVGAMVQGFWYDIPNHFDHVSLGEFVVMPNHVHGILILDDHPVNNAVSVSAVETLQCNVSTVDSISPVDPINPFFQSISPKSGSVPTIIRSFKSVCTKYINRYQPDLHFAWQTRYHDHIIRNADAFERISDYIRHNPKKWAEDRFYLPDETENISNP